MALWKALGSAVLGARTATAPAAARPVLSTLSAAVTGSAHVCQKRVFASLSKDAPFGVTRMPGAPGSPYTPELKFHLDEIPSPFPCYRVMDEKGQLLDKHKDVGLEDATLLRMFDIMLKIDQMDEVLTSAAGQGRLTFYMPNTCEQGWQVGSAAALGSADMVYPAYREVGVFLWKGFTVKDVVNQCMGNAGDTGKGRQLPVHYGDRELNIHHVSSPVGTQIPQAVGYAYAAKRDAEEAGLPLSHATIVYYGDGASSTGDASVGYNMAAVLGSPLIFFLKNNGFCISASPLEQFRGSLAARGPAHGIRTIRVDGHDAVAVYHATKAARQITVEEGQPVLIEALAYRGGNHSTSDDSTRYRDPKETEYWFEEAHPGVRMEKFLAEKGLWNPENTKAVAAEIRESVLETVADCEKIRKLPIREVFTDVYDKKHARLAEQERHMLEHVQKYPERYKLDQFLPDGGHGNAARGETE